MPVLLEGLMIDEILALPKEDLVNLVLGDQTLVFTAGTAKILGKFKVSNETLFVELAHIDGGGEGALPSLAKLATRYAQREGLRAIEWRVHAVRCANPNLKLRRFLQRKGFVVRDEANIGECYWMRQDVSSDSA